MKKEEKKSQNKEIKNEQKSELVTSDDLLFLHFNLVKHNSYSTYMSFTKKHALDDFSLLLTKMFNKKGD